MEVFAGDGLAVVGRVSGEGREQKLEPLATLDDVEKHLRRAVGSADMKRVRDSSRRALELVQAMRARREAQA